MKILLVEDNEKLAHRVKLQLMDQRYVVVHVRTGEEALERVEVATYGVIILDLGLPTISGGKVCKAIRGNGVRTPILILTGTGGIASKVRLLDNGADDYLTKPFNGDELRARVAALVRRQPSGEHDASIDLPRIVINTDERKVYRDGRTIRLRRKEFDILAYLASNNGRVVTRRMIVQHVWNTSEQKNTNTIDVHIKTLRDQLDRPFETPIIHTERGLGYKVDIPSS